MYSYKTATIKHTLQGSVATQVRCAGGVFNNHFIANFLQSAPVKNFENQSIFGEDIKKSVQLTFGVTVRIDNQAFSVIGQGFQFYDNFYSKISFNCNHFQYYCTHCCALACVY